MAANTALTVTGLSYDTIRANLRDFIAAKPDFADYDFEDSAIGTLLSLLAYHAYYNAFYTNMAASEAFIDSAQFYDSVVSRAKLQGYVPVSARGATANVKISFTTASYSASNPTLLIPQNTKFRATINGVAYTFVTPESYTVAANSSNRFQAFIQLVEGLPLTHRFVYTTSNTSFILPNDNVDTRSLSVQVISGANTQTYLQADDILVVNSSSKVFYLEADRDNKYKIAFGDNYLGRKPDNNSVVAVSYRVCNATKGNGANNFSATGSIAGQVNFTLTVEERATGGASQEGIESVRFNAPRAYETQNRAVIDSDYARIIKRDNTDLEVVSTWGGQDNDPPIYGKVFVSAKPYQGTLISSARKTQIKTAIKKYNVRGIDVEFVDPTLLYIKPTVDISYDASKTTLSASQIAALVAQRIIDYETNNFNQFEGKFWASRFQTYLDQSDQGIVGSSVQIDLQKRFTPSTTIPNTYTFRFNAALNKFGPAEKSAQPLGWLGSSGFTSKGFTNYLEDTGFGIVRSYYRSTSLGDRIYTNTTQGTIDYDDGTVILTNFLPTAFVGSEMKINVRPASPNVEAIRNQLLYFADASVTVTEIKSRTTGASLTTIATQGQSTTLNETGLLTTVF